jgi:hypothetical protein
MAEIKSNLTRFKDARHLRILKKGDDLLCTIYIKTTGKVLGEIQANARDLLSTILDALIETSKKSK